MFRDYRAMRPTCRRRSIENGDGRQCSASNDSAIGKSMKAPPHWSSAGRTGEAPTLSRTEHDQIVRMAVDVARWPRTGDRRSRIQFDKPGHRTGQGCRELAGADADLVGRAVLQQADPGRHVRPFSRDCRIRLVFRSFSTTFRRARCAALPMQRSRAWPKAGNSSGSWTQRAT